MSNVLRDSEAYSEDFTEILGQFIGKHLNYGVVDKVARTVSSRIFVLRRLSEEINIENLLSVHYGVVYPLGIRYSSMKIQLI